MPMLPIWKWTINDFPTPPILLWHKMWDRYLMGLAFHVAGNLPIGYNHVGLN